MCVLFTQSCPTLCHPFTIAHQAPLSMGVSKQEYWSGLSFPSPGGLPDSGIETRSLASKTDSLPSEPTGKPRCVDYFEGMYALIFGEGNGTPLQYSCLENPMDGGAWWAAVHGVAKSRT